MNSRTVFTLLSVHTLFLMIHFALRNQYFDEKPMPYSKIVGTSIQINLKPFANSKFSFDTIQACMLNMNREFREIPHPEAPIFSMPSFDQLLLPISAKTSPHVIQKKTTSEFWSY